MLISQLRQLIREELKNINFPQLFKGLGLTTYERSWVRNIVERSQDNDDLIFRINAKFKGLKQKGLIDYFKKTPLNLNFKNIIQVWQFQKFFVYLS